MSIPIAITRGSQTFNEVSSNLSAFFIKDGKLRVALTAGLELIGKQKYCPSNKHGGDQNGTWMSGDFLGKDGDIILFISNSTKQRAQVISSAFYFRLRQTAPIVMVKAKILTHPDMSVQKEFDCFTARGDVLSDEEVSKLDIPLIGVRESMINANAMENGFIVNKIGGETESKPNIEKKVIAGQEKTVIRRRRQRKIKVGD